MFRSKFFLTGMVLLFALGGSSPFFAQSMNFDDLRQRSNEFFQEAESHPDELRQRAEPGEILSMESALQKAADVLIADLPGGVRIAIIDLQVDNTELKTFVTYELEHYLHNAGLIIVDRQHLDRITLEGSFIDFNDQTAVTIGKSAGANVVILGMIHGEAELRRLRLRALDVQTAQVLATASERLDPNIEIGSPPRVMPQRPE